MAAGRARIAANPKDFITLGIEQIGRRDAVDTVEITADLLGSANHGNAFRNITFEHAGETAGGKAAIAFLPIDRNDREFLWPVFLDVFGEFPELGIAGGSPTGEKRDQDRAPVERGVVDPVAAHRFGRDQSLFDLGCQRDFVLSLNGGRRPDRKSGHDNRDQKTLEHLNIPPIPANSIRLT